MNERVNIKKETLKELFLHNEGRLIHKWDSYFPIYGLDIDPRCKPLEEENVKIFIGSQSDRKYLKWLKEQIPKVDILIDDGGHTMQQ
ncbi:hypothetical protein LJC57_04435 [Parabacteroides sp. OttesenSCG-928-G07]|nr:hypothetical protein [Parabacteroides sp. OttesenSCG-928-G21]MDL2277821.1 hypothetical protein [Parabacteroides sp. OttesenSCG-928-G07]